MLATPFDKSATRNPLFVRDVRGIKWAWPRERFQRMRRRILLLTPVGMIALWLVLSMLWYADVMRNAYYSPIPMQAFYDASASAMALLIATVILAGFALDVSSIQASLNSISGEITAGRWDLLRLTALSERGIVNAKYGVAQVRVWRAAFRLVSARVVILLIMLLYTFVMPIVVFGYSGSLRVLSYSLVDDPISTLVAFATFALVCVVFVIEPLWRVKAMTALGLVISSYVLNPAMGILAGLGVTFVVWIMQIIVLSVLIFGSLFLGSTAFFIYDYGTALPVFIYFLLVTVMTAATIYGFYHLLQTWGLRRATLRILNSN